MTTVADLIERVYELTLGGRRAASVFFLDFGINSSATTLYTQEDMSGSVRVGSVLEVDDEKVYVRAVAGGGLSCTVVRGWEGTTAAVHVEDTPVYVQPVLSQRLVRATVQEEIQSLNPTLFSVDSYDITTVSGQNFYDLSGAIDDATVIRPLGWWVGPDSYDESGIWVRPRARFVRNLPSTGLGKIGVHLVIPISDGRTLRVQVATRFVTTDMSGTVDITDIGLDPNWVDIVTYGAAARLVGPIEAQRAIADRVASTAGMVQAGQRANASSWLKKVRDSRLREASLELAARFPLFESS